MGKSRRAARRFSKAVFENWELLGWLLWMGITAVTEALSFIWTPIIAPFLVDAHIGLKILYGVGLAILLFLLIVAIIKLLQFIFRLFKGGEDGQAVIKQDTGGGPGTSAIVSEGARSQQQAGIGNTQSGNNSPITHYNIDTWNGDLPPSSHLPIIEPDSDETNEILLNLRRLRSDGVMLRNAVQRISDLEFLQHWVQEVQKWRLDVVEQIEKLSPIDASFFETLNTFLPLQPQAKVEKPVQKLVEGIEHQRWANIHNERLNRLEQFMSTFKRQPS